MSLGAGGWWWGGGAPIWEGFGGSGSFFTWPPVALLGEGWALWGFSSLLGLLSARGLRSVAAGGGAAAVPALLSASAGRFFCSSARCFCRKCWFLCDSPLFFSIPISPPATFLDLWVCGAL